LTFDSVNCASKILVVAFNIATTIKKIKKERKDFWYLVLRWENVMFKELSSNIMITVNSVNWAGRILVIVAPNIAAIIKKIKKKRTDF